ncbi:MAG: class I SAM-dependent methyltransferase [Myxococcales bacterium]
MVTLREIARQLPLAPQLYNQFRSTLLAVRPKGRVTAHGPAGIASAGHREYVGGMWHEIGRLQFNFLVNQGLRPNHYLLDIACGSLRAGVHFIPYLDAGHYLGVEKEPELVELGLREELGMVLENLKRPELLVNGAFEFERLSNAPDFAIAQSLFTHTPGEVVVQCLRKLRPCMAKDGVFYSTFFVGREKTKNASQAHDHRSWFYTRDELAGFARSAGWSMEYIGDWNHPRNQQMVAFRVAA